MLAEDGNRYCDRCGCFLTKENNKCGYELCDRCNELLEAECGKPKIICDDCILDKTDACPRGTGRAVDDEICENFMREEVEQVKEADYVFIDLKCEGEPPYYSILAYDKKKDEVIDGFGTYDIKVLSGYLKKYFGMPKINNCGKENG